MKLARALSELIDTERDYVRDLEVLIAVYCTPLQAEGVLDAAQCQSLFSGLPVLVNLNREVLKQLQDVSGQAPDPSDVSDVLIRMADFLRMYTEYCYNYPKAMRLLDELLKTNKEFKAFCDRACEHPDCNTGRGRLLLGDFLIKPAQRICKYPLLLKALIGSTEEDHPDRARLESAESKIVAVVNEINEKKREAEAREQCLVIQQSLEGAGDLTLVDAARQLVRSGTVKFGLGNSLAKRQVWLFNDMMVVAKPKAFNAGMYVFRQVLRLEHTLCKARPDLAKALELVHVLDQRTYTVAFGDAKSKAEWLGDIHANIEHHLTRGQEAHTQQLEAVAAKLEANKGSDRSSVRMAATGDASEPSSSGASPQPTANATPATSSPQSSPATPMKLQMEDEEWTADDDELNYPKYVLEAVVTGFPDVLGDLSSRAVVRTGLLKKMNPHGKIQPRFVVLLSDVVLYCRLKGRQRVSGRAARKVEVKGYVPLSLCQVVADDPLLAKRESSNMHGFSIIRLTDMRKIDFFARSRAAKMTWVHDVEGVIQALKAGRSYRPPVRSIALGPKKAAVPLSDLDNDTPDGVAPASETRATPASNVEPNPGAADASAPSLSADADPPGFASPATTQDLVQASNRAGIRASMPNVFAGRVKPDGAGAPRSTEAGKASPPSQSGAKNVAGRAPVKRPLSQPIPRGALKRITGGPGKLARSSVRQPPRKQFPSPSPTRRLPSPAKKATKGWKGGKAVAKRMPPKKGRKLGKAFVKGVPPKKGRKGGKAFAKRSPPKKGGGWQGGSKAGPKRTLPKKGSADRSLPPRPKSVHARVRARLAKESVGPASDNLLTRRKRPCKPVAVWEEVCEARKRAGSKSLQGATPAELQATRRSFRAARKSFVAIDRRASAKLNGTSIGANRSRPKSVRKMALNKGAPAKLLGATGAPPPQ